jgi:ankyrin repeat protein
MASQKGHQDVVELLLSKNADVNAEEDVRRETALHLAAYYGHFAVARLLINADADRTIQNKDDETPLSLARREGHQDIEVLLGGGG